MREGGAMEPLLERLIAEFHERELPQPTPRNVKLPWLPGKADAVVGMRRSGKTWFLYRVVQDRVAAGIPKEHHLYVNFEDDRLAGLTAEHLDLLLQVYYRRIPAARDAGATILLDEVQNVPGWERFVRRVLDTERAHVCLTGSSAALLARELATAMRGRSIATEMFPFDYGEFLAHRGIATPERPPGGTTRSLLEARLGEFLTQGGFPEVQDLDPWIRRRVLQDYVDVVVLRDVAERHAITNVPALRYVVRQLLHTPGGMFSVNKLYNDLKSQGLVAGRTLVHQMIEALEDAYLVFRLPLADRSLRRRQVNPPKVYPVDPGLAHCMSPATTPEWGRLLETALFLWLRRRGWELGYHRTSSGREVDFLATSPQGARWLIQACADLQGEETRARELRALGEAMEETGIPRAAVVTLYHEERLSVGGKAVHVIPAWRWFLWPPEGAGGYTGPLGP